MGRTTNFRPSNFLPEERALSSIEHFKFSMLLLRGFSMRRALEIVTKPECECDPFYDEICEVCTGPGIPALVKAAGA